MDRKYSRLLCRAIPNSSITCPPSPAIMRLRRVRFSNGATNLYWVRLYTAQYVVFLQSKVNGTLCAEEWLSSRSWKWPENTYLQRRLNHLRRYRSSDFDDHINLRLT